MDEEVLKKLEQNMAAYNDEEINEILKKRSHYNPSAARLAIGEAIRRGLINSEQDLMSDEYQVQPLRFHLFPPIEKGETREKVIQSLARSILLTGIIPIIFGFLRFSVGRKMEAFLLFCLSGLWVLSAAMLMRTKQLRYIYMTLVVASLAVIYIVNFFLQRKSFNIMDVVVAIVVFGIVFYSAFYIKILLKTER